MSCTKIIVMGANGRMGQMISGHILQGDDFELAGVVERAGSEAGLERYKCSCSTDLAQVLKEVKDGVVIDFTSPEASLENARKVAQAGAKSVIGTTGLNSEQQQELRRLAEETPIFWAPNMSVGVNVLLQVLPELVQKLGLDYDLEMSEIHHKHKKDAPSGTALKLAECLAEARGQNLEEVGRYCREGIIGPRSKDEIGVQTLRGGDVVGDHTVYFFGTGERIEITHRAHSRDTFAKGALRAARWLDSQKAGRLYSMSDMLISQ